MELLKRPREYRRAMLRVMEYLEEQGGEVSLCELSCQVQTGLEEVLEDLGDRIEVLQSIPHGPSVPKIIVKLKWRPPSPSPLGVSPLGIFG